MRLDGPQTELRGKRRQVGPRGGQTGKQAAGVPADPRVGLAARLEAVFQTQQEPPLGGPLPVVLGQAREVLAAFEAEQPGKGVETPRSAAPALSPLIEPLSQRELDILRLFKTELSGPEIARELVIALSTVRTHTKSIYSKLNVNSRRAAVKRAIELGLI